MTHMWKAMAAGLAATLVAAPVAGAPADSSESGSLARVTEAAEHGAPAQPGARAGTAVTIGQSSGMFLVGCGTPDTGVQSAVSGTTPSYTVPSPGVITSFSHRAGGGAGQIRVLLFVPAATGHYTVVGKSALESVTPSVLNTFPTRIPVPAGALLGGQMTSGSMACAFTGLAGDAVSYGSFDPDVSTDFAPIDSGPYRWNTSAVLEPDADGDQYGDLTQDACPQSALTRAACPAPKTKIKGRSVIDAKGRIVIRFKSSIADSTFLCKIDKKKYRPCSSPIRKRFGPGTHKVRIQAISPFGIPDPTPLTVRMRFGP